ncbi:hypothetical protein KL86DYS2_10308 [uncultured Dysgonomonas sp.]|uniref:Uncharacterized protein n=1 Tax=uncultured Dysgonomonas sp. TaxID=206096 RepID=A0A212IY72_9BACT|nr:hypothetical protein KL86DYS2_10308 [uncultured Dysgonomonas sp.]
MYQRILNPTINIFGLQIRKNEDPKERSNYTQKSRNLDQIAAFSIL